MPAFCMRTCSSGGGVRRGRGHGGGACFHVMRVQSRNVIVSPRRLSHLNSQQMDQLMHSMETCAHAPSRYDARANSKTGSP